MSACIYPQPASVQINAHAMTGVSRIWVRPPRDATQAITPFHGRDGLHFGTGEPGDRPHTAARLILQCTSSPAPNVRSRVAENWASGCYFTSGQPLSLTGM